MPPVSGFASTPSPRPPSFIFSGQICSPRPDPPFPPSQRRLPSPQPSPAGLGISSTGAATIFLFTAASPAQIRSVSPRPPSRGPPSALLSPSTSAAGHPVLLFTKPPPLFPLFTVGRAKASSSSSTAAGALFPFLSTPPSNRPLHLPLLRLPPRRHTRREHEAALRCCFSSRPPQIFTAVTSSGCRPAPCIAASPRTAAQPFATVRQPSRQSLFFSLLLIRLPQKI